MDSLFSNVLSNLRSHLSSRDNASIDMLSTTDLAGLVEQAVDTVDPRIRVITNYKKRLKKPVSAAWHYLNSLVSQLPDVLEVSPQTISADPRIKLIFSNTDELQKLFRESSDFADFLSGIDHRSMEYVYVVLCMRKKESSILGTELQGEILKREVKKTIVSFYNHHLLSPAASKTQALDGFKHCVFESLLNNVIANVIELNHEHRYLIERREALRKKYAPNKSSIDAINSGFPLINNAVIPNNQELIEIDQKILEVKNQIASPEQHLDHICTVLTHPDQYIKLNELSIFVDKFGSKISHSSSEQGFAIDMAELEVDRAMNRVAVVFRSPANELTMLA